MKSTRRETVHDDESLHRAEDAGEQCYSFVPLRVTPS